MPGPCPQCRGTDWALVHFCTGCAKKVQGPVTLVLHECPAAPAPLAPLAPEPPAPAPPRPAAAPEPVSAFPC